MSIGAINGINRVNKLYNTNVSSLKGKSSVSNSAFKDIYDSVMKGVEDTNKLQIDSDKITEDFVTGKVDNIHKVMIAQEKANLALMFTVEVRNKAIEAYKELMRMQI